jgi:hypothetical protein
VAVLPAAPAVIGSVQGAGAAGHPDAEDLGQALTLLVDLVFGEPAQQGLLSMRLEAFLNELGPLPLTQAQQRIASAVDARVEALVRHSFRDLGRWQTALRSIANQLEDLERRAKAGDAGEEEEGPAVDESTVEVRHWP